MARVHVTRADLVAATEPVVRAALAVFAAAEVEVTFDLVVRRPPGWVSLHADHRLAGDHAACLATIDAERFEVSVLSRAEWPGEIERVARVDPEQAHSSAPPQVVVEAPYDAVVAGAHDPVTGRLRVVAHPPARREAARVLSWVHLPDGWRCLSPCWVAGRRHVRFTPVGAPDLAPQVQSLVAA